MDFLYAIGATLVAWLRAWWWVLVLVLPAVLLWDRVRRLFTRRRRTR
jgi:hypothetical protein